MIYIIIRNKNNAYIIDMQAIQIKSLDMRHVNNRHDIPLV